MAAALVRGPEGDENWILAEVVSHNGSSGRYEVDDIDEEQKERHTLSRYASGTLFRIRCGSSQRAFKQMTDNLLRRKVIPLPTMRACPETNSEALYPAGTTVMAIYPQTTCFYKGVIKAHPAAGKLRTRAM